MEEDPDDGVAVGIRAVGEGAPVGEPGARGLATVDDEADPARTATLGLGLGPAAPVNPLTTRPRTTMAPATTAITRGEIPDDGGRAICLEDCDRPKHTSCRNGRPDHTAAEMNVG